MTTWYVRKDTTHNATRNGTSLSTGWGGWSEIVWGGAGVKAGDELYICDAHSYSTGISVGAHGGVASAPVTLRGDHSTNPGSIVFTTTTDTLTMGRAYTNLLGLTVAAVSHNGAATNCRYLYCTFPTPGNTSSIRFGASGDNHADIEIRGCNFSTIAPSPTNHAAIRFWVQTAANASMTRLTVEQNTFTTQASTRSVIELRTQTDSNVAATMTDIKINYNIFTGCVGTCIELTCPGTTSSAFQAKGCQVRGNLMTNITETSSTHLGGGIGVWGFGPSTTVGFGDNIVADNQATNLQGPTGFIDAFYGSYIIEDNVGTGFTTTTIDANGILLDIGCINTIVRRNKISNIVGKSGTFNSGCGVMILGKVTNTYVYGNNFDSCRNGLFIGSTDGACDVKVYNNVFTNCIDSGVITTSTAALLNNVICVNNFFSGAGYRVKNQTTSPTVVWNRENFNRFAGFKTGLLNHTHGVKTRLYSDGLAAAYTSSLATGIDGDALNSFLSLPTTLVQLS